MDFLTESELLAVLSRAKKESARDFAMILVSYKHGLRASEAAALTLGDLKDDCLDVKRKKGSLHTIQPLMPHRGEPLLDEIKAIRAWLRVRPDDGSKALFTSQIRWRFVPRASTSHLQRDRRASGNTEGEEVRAYPEA